MEIEELKTHAISSAKWSLLSRVVRILGVPLLFLLLPFWLTPADYGLCSIILSILALLTIIQQVGLIETTIQRENDAEDVRNLAFWVSIGFSILLYIVVYFLSPYLSQFFSNPSLTSPLRVASLQIIFQGLSNIPLAWMQRKFLYQKLAFIQICYSVTAVIITVILAILGMGYWSYVIGVTIGMVLQLLLVLMGMDWKPVFHGFSHLWLESLRFGNFVMLEALLGWFFIWFDNIVVARNLGSEALGIYSLAFGATTTIISLPTSAITGVTLSTFSRMQSDLRRLGESYVKGIRLIAMFAIPAGIGLCLFSSPLAAIVYSQKWVGLGSIMSILSLYAGFGYLWILNTDAFKSIGKPETMVKIYLPVLLIMMPAYIISSHYGLLTFTIVRSMIVVVSAFPHTYFAIKLLQLPKNYLWTSTRLALLASSVMAAVIYPLLMVVENTMIGSNAVKMIVLLSLILLGAFIYLGVTLIFDSKYVKQVIGLVKQALG
ncbi:MAG: lipopolysaccharide biosynthesis protein [Anaerolineaceae bacterium]|jgi:PST family polysaccharide transporter